MTNNLFPYPGNKARHAEWIIQHIPEHTCYVEPFGGAAGVLFNKPPSKVEAYNDANGDIVHFFEVLRDQCDELQEWLECVPFSRQLHDEWATAYYEGDRPDDDIERAGRFFYLRYTQWGGKIDANKGFATRVGRNSPAQLADKTERLQEFADRLRHVYIECLDWAEILNRYDSPDTVFYLDPPYQDSEQMYNSGGFDHRELYDRICAVDGQCVLSYDTVPDWYGDGFHVRSTESCYYIDNVDSTESKEATENLIMDFDPDDTPAFSEAGQTTLSEMV